jgi:hypothetical protein
MNMSHFPTRSSLLALAAALALSAVACASQPTPPPVAAAPPAQAFQQAAGGVTALQGSPDDSVQFVEQEHKEPTVHGYDTPATNLNPSATHPKY